MSRQQMRQIFLSSLLLICASVQAIFAKDIVLADDQGAHAAIVVDKTADPAEQHAAAELAAILGKVTGKNFPLAHERDAAKTNLLVGIKAARMADAHFSTEGLGDEGI